jgi:hypothetical protein
VAREHAAQLCPCEPVRRPAKRGENLVGEWVAQGVAEEVATGALRIGQVLRHRAALTTAIYAKVDRDALPHAGRVTALAFGNAPRGASFVTRGGCREKMVARVALVVVLLLVAVDFDPT